MSTITQSYPIKTGHSGIIKRPKHNTPSPNTSPRLRSLAQARCLAQASLPSPRREDKNQRCGHYGISLKRDPSRLGEWPARSKGERVAWARFRAENLPVSSRLGEIDSLGRDLQVPPLFITETAIFSGQTTHARYFHTSKRQIPSHIQQITHKSSKKRPKTKTLTSRTWNKANSWGFWHEQGPQPLPESDSQLEQWMERVTTESPSLQGKLNKTETVKVEGTYVSRTVAKPNVNLRDVGTLAEECGGCSSPQGQGVLL